MKWLSGLLANHLLSLHVSALGFKDRFFENKVQFIQTVQFAQTLINFFKKLIENVNFLLFMHT